MKRKRAYLRYKPSGVEWLGDVPEHWDVKKLKYSFQLLTTKTENHVNPIALENIESWTGRLIVTETEFDGEGIAFIKDDLLFGKLRPYLAKVLKAELPGEAVGDFFVMRPQQSMNPEYAAFSLRSEDFINIIDGSTFGSKMPRASWEFMGSVKIPLPPLPEQQAIAAYLDLETGRIDRLLAKKERLIELLREKRSALISHAVTKGIDTSVKLKPSGVEWLGDVPEHWKVKRLVFMLERLQDGTHFSPESDITGDFLYVTAKNIKEWGLDLSNITYVTAEDHRSIYSRCPVKQGDVLYIKDGATAGIATVNRMEQPFSMLSSVAMLRPKAEECNCNFLSYHLNAKEFKSYALNSLVGGAMTRFTLEIISKFRLISPPLIEQQTIAAFLDRETGKIDALIAKVEDAIAKLKEYRTALISAAVTGKIDVREAA